MSWRLLAVALIIILFHGERVVRAEEFKVAGEQVEKVVEQARKTAETMSLPENVHKQEGQEVARQSVERLNASTFREQVRCQIERIQAGNLKQEQVSATQGKGTLSAQENIYLFLSSSMPEAVVNRYLIDVSRTGEQRLVPVLFGLPQGLAGKRLNADYFSRVMQADPGCRDTTETPCQRLAVPLRVNPELFARYTINEVPALVHDNGQDSWSIHGEAELAYLLEKIGKAANNPTLDNISVRLRGNQ